MGSGKVEWMGPWTGLVCFRFRHVAGPCKGVNELPGFINTENFLTV
jgi:hypothetical protein